MLSSTTHDMAAPIGGRCVFCPVWAFLMFSNSMRDLAGRRTTRTREYLQRGLYILRDCSRKRNRSNRSPADVARLNAIFFKVFINFLIDLCGQCVWQCHCVFRRTQGVRLSFARITAAPNSIEINIPRRRRRRHFRPKSALE